MFIYLYMNTSVYVHRYGILRTGIYMGHVYIVNIFTCGCVYALCALVCVDIHPHQCIRACMHKHIHACMHIYIPNTQTNTNSFMYAHIHLYIPLYKRNTHAYVRIHISFQHICMYIHNATLTSYFHNTMCYGIWWCKSIELVRP